ncbi:glycosyltransferase family 39 protein [Kaistia geumhonensis]|uniref:4-amino-4-deoxy-L-arabinose transferase-like glycosyltransferase n=1 Tax=Kaistia geumhonensis TaxID=410839 RepID=A0ABU0M0W2_9HYPH|nr:glycosyltransferase family 39 protein [Kaistia geumhonensis]MCX5480283.1 glycosyltransferase family 39 protein [Kaistia geumhonensis]MDQ0514485.1 4-amino-4-deoxy-L-arabinose transferase-like glycosyltransferase [Kaistia geumhonensis]
MSSTVTPTAADGERLRRIARAIETLVDRLAASPAASLAAIAIVAFLAFLPGFTTLPPIDRDEPRFAQATHQMVESGNYLDIRFQDEARYKKPIGIYWLQSAAVFLTGSGPDAPIYIYRLPSIIGGIAAAMLTWWVTIAFGRPRAALLAGMLVATTILLGVEARLAKTDMMLLVTITAAHGALARAFLSPVHDRSLRLAAIFWTALGASILLKGPVGMGAIVCPVVVLSIAKGSFAWLKRLAPLPGLVWMVIVVAPWFIAIGLASGGAFYQEALGKDLFQKVVSVQESHGAPPGAYALIFVFTFWPLAAYFLAGLGSILDRLRQPALLYAAASVIPYWLAVEAVPTKLPHYVLPLFPLMAMVTADAIDRGVIHRESRHWFMRFLALAPVLMPLALAIVGVAIALLLGDPVSVAGVLILVVAAGVGLVSAGLFRVSTVASAFVAGLAAVVAYWGAFGQVLPGLQQTRLSERLVAAGDAAASCARPAFASAGFEEPSLVFLGGTSIALVDGERAASFLAEGGCRVAFVEKRQLPMFNSRADDLGLAPKERAVVGGYNINGGRFLEMHVFTASGAAK